MDELFPCRFKIPFHEFDKLGETEDEVIAVDD
jgi:hypothetical protein